MYKLISFLIIFPLDTNNVFINIQIICPTVSPTAGLKVEEVDSVESSSTTNSNSNSGPNHPTSDMIIVEGCQLDHFLYRFRKRVREAAKKKNF